MELIKILEQVRPHQLIPSRSWPKINCPVGFAGKGRGKLIIQETKTSFVFARMPCSLSERSGDPARGAAGSFIDGFTPQLNRDNKKKARMSISDHPGHAW
jgi:hypothetical protein